MTITRINAQPDWQQAVEYTLQRLESELSDSLYYHSLKHTRDEVVPFAENVARLLDLEAEACQLIRVAAFFHDIGFIEQRADHELAGIRIASAVLPKFGFRDEHIETISSMIYATRLPQSPRNLLDEILADADLNLLGQPYFLQRNHDLRREIETIRGHMDDAEWYNQQLGFLENHRYFTEAARSLLDRGKQQNIRALAELAGRA